MPQFVKVEDVVFDLEKISYFEKTPDRLVIWILDRENPVYFTSDQAKEVYGMLLKALTPLVWDVTIKEGTGAYK